MAIQFAFKKMFINNYDEKMRDPLVRKMNDVSVFVLDNWYFFVGFIIAYAILFFAMRNSRPNTFREGLDKYLLFKQHRSLISSVTLISIALEMKMSEGENEAEVVKRVASQSGPWAKAYLMQMYAGLQSGRISLHEGMSKSHLFTDELRSQIGAIQAVESDDSGLISAAIEAGGKSAENIESYVEGISNYVSSGVALIMLLLMVPMMSA